MAHVLVTGATGVVGRAVVRHLSALGHRVSALARGRADRVKRAGAEPVDVDLYDVAALPGAMRGVDVVMHLATRIPPFSRMAVPGAWDENNRLRHTGTGLLVDAALTADVQVVLLHSIVFTYADGGDAWLGEHSPMDVPPSSSAMIVAEQHVARFTRAGRRGVILRNGLFYGAGCASVHEGLAWARRGLSTTMGPHHAFFSSIHVEDCARATALATTLPAGIYNLVDDDPVPRGEYVAAFANAFNVPTPWMAWPAAVRAVGGRDAEMLMRSQRVSNRRLRDALGWSPRFPSVRAGWPAVAAELEDAALPA